MKWYSTHKWLDNGYFPRNTHDSHTKKIEEEFNSLVNQIHFKCLILVRLNIIKRPAKQNKKRNKTLQCCIILEIGGYKKTMYLHTKNVICKGHHYVQWKCGFSLFLLLLCSLVVLRFDSNVTNFR